MPGFKSSDHQLEVMVVGTDANLAGMQSRLYVTIRQILDTGAGIVIRTKSGQHVTLPGPRTQFDEETLDLLRQALEELSVDEDE